METFKIVFILLILSIVAVLTYSLSKSFFFFDKGIELKEEELVKEEKIEPSFPKDSVSENAKVLWKNYIFLPTELSREAGGFGPEGFLNHAKNLTFINLQSGKLKKVFDRKAYIWDFFPGEFTKKAKPYSEGEPIKEKESLEIGQKLIILAMTIDTNKDGFLNQKDKIKLFIFDPHDEKLLSVLPEEYYFEKLLYNTKKNLLVSTIRKLNSKNQTEEIIEPASIFIYDTGNGKSSLVDLSNN